MSLAPFNPAYVSPEYGGGGSIAYGGGGAGVLPIDGAVGSGSTVIPIIYTTPIVTPTATPTTTTPVIIDVVTSPNTPIKVDTVDTPTTQTGYLTPLAILQNFVSERPLITVAAVGLVVYLIAGKGNKK